MGMITKDEKDILLDLELTLPKRVIDTVVNAVETLLGDTERLSTTDEHGNYIRRFAVRQETGGTIVTARFCVAFIRMADKYEDKGFFVEMSGECSDGEKVFSVKYDRDWVGGLKDDSSMTGLVRLIEDYQPVDWLYAKVEQFCEYLRDNLDELGEDTRSEVVA